MAKRIPKNPVLPEHAELFEKFMDKWKVMLNLSDWRFQRKPGHAKEMAEISEMFDSDKVARWRIGKDFGTGEVNDATLEDTAIHEVLHVRLRPLIAAVTKHGEDSDEVSAAEHEVIIVLCGLLMKLVMHEAGLMKTAE